MARKKSSPVKKRLVVDATVARSADGYSEHPKSKYCRDFLRSMMKICHSMVMTEAIFREWDKHQSNYSRKWRSSMERKGKIAYPDLSPTHNLRNRIRQKAENEDIANIMLKDIHLIEAASQIDNCVISGDEKVRLHFSNIANDVGALKNIIWVNPEKESETPIEWLENNAKSEAKRKLSRKRN